MGLDEEASCKSCLCVSYVYVTEPLLVKTSLGMTWLRSHPHHESVTYNVAIIRQLLRFCIAAPAG